MKLFAASTPPWTFARFCLGGKKNEEEKSCCCFCLFFFAFIDRKSTCKTVTPIIPPVTDFSFILLGAVTFGTDAENRPEVTSSDPDDDGLIPVHQSDTDQSECLRASVCGRGQTTYC